MADLATLIAGYRRRLEAVPQVAAASVTGRIVAAAPVDTGALRASIQPDRPFASLRIGESLRVSSDLPYAGVIEFLGTSRQAPAGHWRVNLAAWGGVVDDAIRSVR